MDAPLGLEQARLAFEQGDKALARRLLRPIIRQAPNNEAAWLLFAEVAETPEQAIAWFERVLQINPQHALARQRLEELRNLSALSADAPPPDVPLALPVTPSRPWPRAVLVCGCLALAGVALICAAGAALLASQYLNLVPSLSAAPSPTAQAAPPTATPIPATPMAAPTATLVPTLPTTPTAIPAAYIPPDCQSAAPATIPPATTIAEPTPSLDANPPVSTAEQLRVFDDLADTITEVYLYPDFNGLDWPGLVAEYRAKVEGGLETEAFYTEMENFVTALGDEHSHFESPVQVAKSEAELSGAVNYVGIGVLVQPLPEKGRVTILSVFPGSSAERGGLQPHDSLLAVDGVPIVEDGQAYPQRVRGPECSAVVVTVQSPGQAPRDVTFIRYHITSSLPIEARLAPTTDGARIGYIFLPTFFDGTIAGQVRLALQDFGPLDGLILDNRMNGGGSSSVVEPILSYFTSGTLGHFVTRTESRPLTVDANPIHNSQSVPLVILIGEDTVSFGEIFSGALQDIGRARLVGQTTLGNVETLHGYRFDDGSRVWIAEERFDPLVSDADWEQDGVRPDVEAYADWDTFTFENDPSVAAAVALLGH
jgi:carboxyl-terminal processing protease